MVVCDVDIYLVVEKQDDSIPATTPTTASYT
jgi:hypothetical protein